MGGETPPVPPWVLQDPPQGPPLSPQTGWGLLKVFFFSLSLWSGSTGVTLGGDDDTQGHTGGGGCNGPLSPAGGEEGEVTIPVPSPPGKDWDRDHPQSPSGGNGRGWGGTTHMDRDKPSVPSPPREGFEGGGEVLVLPPTLGWGGSWEPPAQASRVGGGPGGAFSPGEP